MSETQAETTVTPGTNQTFDLGEELSKVKDVLGAFWAKIPHNSEEEATAVAQLIDSIGPQPEPEPVEETAATPATDSLAGLSDAELQAELAKRQAAAAGTGQ